MTLLCLMLLDVMIPHKNKQTMPRPPRADSALLAPLCDDQTNNQTNRETNKHFTIRHTPAQLSFFLCTIVPDQELFTFLCAITG